MDCVRAAFCAAALEILLLASIAEASENVRKYSAMAALGYSDVLAILMSCTSCAAALQASVSAFSGGLDGI